MKNQKSEEILVLFKTSITKIALEECLKRKEEAKNEDEYQSLFIELSKILFIIDHSKDWQELNNYFAANKFPLLETDEYRNVFEEVVEKYANKLLRYTE